MDFDFEDTKVLILTTNDANSVENMVDLQPWIFRSMNILITSCVSVVVSSDICRFKLALPLLLFISVW